MKIAEHLTGIVGLVLAISLLVDVAIFFASWIYSRFIFNGYLKKHHKAKWDELIYEGKYQGLNILSWDKTPQIRHFREESNDNLGDPNIPRMRAISIYLFKVAVLTWISIVAVVISGGILLKFLGEK